MQNAQGKLLNVYNFIPFSGKKSKNFTDTDQHTGVIEYSIKTKTPLFIPNTSNSDEYDKDAKDRAYDFFSYTSLKGKTDFDHSCEFPIIPGSELRGMVRSIYEAITNSCMSVLNSEIRPSKRTGEIFQAGVIEKEPDGTYKLLKAEDCIFQKKRGRESFANTWKTTDFLEGQRVWFKKEDRSKGKPLVLEIFKCQNDTSTRSSGYLIKGMKGPENKDKKKEKHNAHVFIPDKSKNAIVKVLDSADIEGLFCVIQSYQKQPGCEESYEEYKGELDKFIAAKPKDCMYFPVYYSLLTFKGNRQLLYLSPAAITKEISNHSIGDLAGEYAPCVETHNCCPACDLFGMVGSNKEQSLASKIRFTDAYVITEEHEPGWYYDEPVTLPEMSTPKLGNTEFYLQRPGDADFWTYDYDISNKGSIGYIFPELRGRKFYWNQPNMELPSNVEKNKRNKTVRPVKRDKEFCGKVYFDKISEKQLKQLLWILNCGCRNEQENDIVFKLGSGKPLGFGSVQLSVKEVKERSLCVSEGELHYLNEKKETYKSIDSYDALGFDSNCKEDFFAMVSFEKMKSFTISYPMTDQQKRESGNKKSYAVEEGFQWFVENHLVYPKRRGAICFNQPPEKKMPQERRQNYVKEILAPAREIWAFPVDGKNMPEKNIQRDQYLIGVVKRYSENSKKVYVKIDNEHYKWLHVSCFSRTLQRRVDLRTEFPIDTRIYFKELGKDEKGYMQYEYLRKE